MSLIELVMTLGLMASVMASVVGVIATSLDIWEAYDSDHTRIESTNAAMRFMVRTLRDADSIERIRVVRGQPSDLTARLADGRQVRFRFRRNRLEYREGTGAWEYLADNIAGTTFVAFAKDAVSRTANPAEMQIVECAVFYRLERSQDPDRSLVCRVWLRERS